MAARHLIDLDDYTPQEWDEIIRLAADIRIHPRDYMERCRGRIMATLFYEPSTRTQMSFQAAMLRLGGQIIGFDNPGNSSVAKGESIKDTVRIVSGYSDVIVIRHPQEGAAKAASMYALCPVVNAGDGGHLHPTQTLTDLLTLRNEKGRLTGLSIGVCGDLKYGRTVHSLIKAMSRFPGNRFTLISTPELGAPGYVKDVMTAAGCPFEEVNTLDECIGKLDVLYMTRIQKERFATPQDYEKNRGVYVLDAEKLARAKEDLAVLHPLPRVDEITPDVDDDRRAAYFRQAENGMYVRMALVLKMLEEPGTAENGPATRRVDGLRCQNPRCVTHTEKYLPGLFRQDGEALSCAYCDAGVEPVGE